MRHAWHLRGLMVLAAAAFAITAAFGSALPARAQGTGGHVHGLAHLQVAIDDATVQLNLITPLDNLVGFEHAPGNEKQRHAVREMASKFHRADSLFIFTPEARCRLESVDLESPVLSPGLLASSAEVGGTAQPDAGGGAAQARHGDAHGELEAVWQFQCARPLALDGLEIKLFQMFPGLQRLHVAIAGPKGQSSARLSPKSSRLKW